MGRKEKVSAYLKLEAIKAYLSGQQSITELSLQLQVNESSVRNWVRKFEMGGPHKICVPNTNKVYSEALKMAAITDYLENNMSQFQLCDKYEISSTSILRGWINKYTNHGKISSQKNKGEVPMNKGRKTTYEERLAIVAYCIENNDNYYLASDKYGVSYQQVYSWVKKYKQDGKESLMDRRGQRIHKEPLTESEKLTEQLRLLEAENKRLKMENDFLKKVGGDRKESINKRIKQEAKYLSIQALHKQENYKINDLCLCANIPRSSYYKWLNCPESKLDKENKKVLSAIVELYNEVEGIFGYRQMTLHLTPILRKKYNYKRIYRLMKSVNIQSVIRKKKRRYKYCAPQVVAENVLNREFVAKVPNQKWLTDVTEFKLTTGKKLYLSAILDLHDRSIVSYEIGDSNNNQLVFKTLDQAIAKNPDASPLFHSDRGF